MTLRVAMDTAKVYEAVRAGHSAAILQQLAEHGITFDSRLGRIGLLNRPADQIRIRDLADGTFACDAQPELVTTPNASIPAWLTNYFDPKLIEILQSPLEATTIVGSEVGKGDWTTTYATFVTVERVGQTSAYGDFNTNGMARANVNFPNRQAFMYQIFTQWGELEMARAANARVDWANQVNQASVDSLNQYQNLTYFFGVAGLINFGLLNDPALYAPLAATAKWNATGTTGDVIYEDLRRMFVQAQNQANGLITQKDPMTLAMSPTLSVALNKTNTFNFNVWDQLKKNFPNIRLETAVQYSTSSGEVVQLIIDSVRGQRTAETAFTSKLRAHAVVVGSSSWSQKKSQSTLGTIIYLPYAIAQLTGA